MLQPNLNEDVFIGRKKEIDAYMQWVNEAKELSLFFIHDASTKKNEQGGIGKTRLLRELHALTKKSHTNIIPVMFDFFSLEDRNSITIARRIVEALRDKYPTWRPARFELSLEEYHNMLLKRGAESVDNREQLAEALAEDLTLLQKWMDQDNSYILLFFDTFERIEDNPATAVLTPGQYFPDNYRFGRICSIVAGRNAPQWSHPEWQGREKAVHLLPLSGFNLYETQRYLQANAPVRIDFTEQPPQTLEALHRLTGGRPILLGLLVDILSNPKTELAKIVEMSRSQLEEVLVQLLDLFGSPIDRTIYVMAHIYHRFDKPILKAISSKLPLPVSPELFDRISHLSFVRTSSPSNDVFVLHDEMRRLVKDYCWPKQDLEKRVRKELSETIIKYYDSRIEDPESEELRESYIVERLFHELFIDVNRGLVSFDKHFDRAMNLSQRAFARALLQEVKKFDEESLQSQEKKDNLLSEEQSKDLRLAEASLLLTEETPLAALRAFKELEDNTAWSQEHLSDIFYGKGNSYRRAEEYADAIRTYQQCLQLAQTLANPSRIAEIYNALGLIARRQDEDREAKDYYEESLSIFKTIDSQRNYAAVLNNLGNLYRLLGEPDKGLLYCKRGLQIRERLFAESKTGQSPIGFSYSTLGHVYFTMEKFDDAEQQYKNAFEIHSRQGTRTDRAMAYCNLGRILAKRKDFANALHNFDQAEKLARGASREAMIEILNQQGRLHQKREKWSDAIDCFTEAVKLSREVKRRFTVAENLLYLAETYDLAKAVDTEGTLAFSAIEEARQVAPNKFMKGRVEEVQGDIYYRKGVYTLSFKHYGVASKFMTQYSNKELDKMLRKLENQLLATPRELLSSIVSSLLTYWSEEQLDEAYPEFSEACRNVAEL